VARTSALSARGSRPEAFGPPEWGLLAAVALMWGSSFLWMDIGLETLRPPVIAMLRIALGLAVLLLFPRSRAPVVREDWPRIALLGVVWSAIPLQLFPIAQDLGLASSAAGMINGAMPLFAAAIAGILLRRPPGPIQAAGLVVGFAGVVLVIVPTAGVGTGTAIGAGLALFSTILYGLAANITVPLAQRYGALPVIARSQLVALVVVLPFGLFSLPGSRFAWSSALAMVALGVFGTGLAYIASTTLLGRAGPTRGAVSIYFIPVVALVLGVVFRDETASLMSLVGVALVLAGAWLTSRRESVDAGTERPLQHHDP
jgi:drug/metabolite transporter (DMT)-like permease